MIDLLEQADKIVWVQGLLVDCPLRKPLANCPAAELRKLTLTDRLKLAKTISEEQIDSIIAHHRNCIAERKGTNQ